MNAVPDRTTDNWFTERIESVEKWTPTLWSVRISRPSGYRFMPGHYARLGMQLGADEPVWRAYSIVSSPAEPFLEFLITVIPGGMFTGRLAELDVGDALLLHPTVMGFFLPNQLAPGKTLWMLSTGSGVGPFVSMLREGGIFGAYDRIIVTHSVRSGSELAYEGEFDRYSAERGVQYIPIVTRAAGITPISLRIPEAIASGQLEEAARSRLEAEHSRVMVCGNPQFTIDMRALLTRRSFQPCRRGFVGSMLFEKYW